MAMLLLQGAQDVLQQQWESGGQGSKSLRHLGGEEEDALSGREGADRGLWQYKRGWSSKNYSRKG